MENQELQNAEVMEEVTKITQEELEKLQKLNQDFNNITMDLGSLEIQRIALKSRKEYMEGIFFKIQKESDEFIESLKNTYGDININTVTGEFTKMNTQG